MNEQLEKALKVLNEALEANPPAIQELMNLGVICDQKLADHPTIQVMPLDDQGRYFLRPLGLINGIVEALTGERVAMVTDDESNKITKFVEYKP